MQQRNWNIDSEEMMEAGVHFGHQAQKWPKMAPYIFTGIHILNLNQTARFLSEACDSVSHAAKTIFDSRYEISSS